jgi:hypothetical protein
MGYWQSDIRRCQLHCHDAAINRFYQLKLFRVGILIGQLAEAFSQLPENLGKKLVKRYCYYNTLISDSETQSEFAENH